MVRSVNDVPKVGNLKRNKAKTAVRQKAVVALSAAGFTQQAIADELGVTRQTVKRDMDDLRPDVAIVRTILERAQTKLRELYPVEERIEGYVAVAKNDTPNLSGYRLAALTRLDAIDGIITDGERMRAERDRAQEQAPAPMFVLPAGTSINVTVERQDVRDVTPTPPTDTPA